MQANRKRTYDEANPEIPVFANRPLEFENMIADYRNALERARHESRSCLGCVAASARERRRDHDLRGRLPVLPG